MKQIINLLRIKYTKRKMCLEQNVPWKRTYKILWCKYAKNFYWLPSNYWNRNIFCQSMSSFLWRSGHQVNQDTEPSGRQTILLNIKSLMRRLFQEIQWIPVHEVNYWSQLKHIIKMWLFNKMKLSDETSIRHRYLWDMNTDLDICGSVYSQPSVCR